MRAPAPEPANDLENLLAEALAKFDEGGEPALAAFVQAHPAHATALERGIRRCREMGLLGSATAAGAGHPERLGEFRLLRRIGGGGMGVVYEAVQEPLGKRVALKIIRPELLFFEGARERFRREVDAIARLEHPAIVSVFSAGEHEGVPYFTMEIVDGVTIEQACARLLDRDPATLRGEDLRELMAAGDASGELFAGEWWEAAVRVAHRVALGLRHAHLRGIVHRDIKPSNVMVTPHGRAVVLDFGVAQVRAARELTRSGAAPGSPAFMSPEQRRGEATDERTDVFSLAATLWQFVTLRRPFRELEAGRIAEVLPNLRAANGAAPPELDLVLRTAMDRDRDRRYGDMAAFAADLQAVLERRPIAARPLGLGLRTLRWCQRHRTTAVASAVALAAAGVMLVALAIVQQAARTALETTNTELVAAKSDLEARNTELRTATSALETANTQLRTAKSDLESEQARTRASLDTSLEALQSILVRLGNDELRAVPQAEPIAHAALQDAAALHRNLLAQHPGDEKVRLLAGRALHALAMSFERQGAMRDALATVDESIAVLGAGDAPAPVVRDMRGHAWMSKASWLVEQPDKAPARAAIANAEADFEAAAAEPSLRAESLRARGELCTSRSLLHDERTEAAAVEVELRRAVDLHRQCMLAGAPKPRDPGMLALRLCNLGRFLHRQNRDAEARPLLEEALAQVQQLPANDTWPPPAVQLAEVQDALGSTLARLQDPDTAEQLLRDAVDARHRAADQYPSNVEFRSRLGGAQHNLANLLWSRERPDEAMSLWETARAHQEAVLAKAPQQPMAQLFLGKHLDALAFGYEKRRDGAALTAAARRLVELPGSNPVASLRVARFFVNAWLYLGKKDSTLLDEAMAQLLVAEQRGLTSAQLPEKDIAALRGRDDYHDWVDRIRARVPESPKK